MTLISNTKRLRQ